MPLAGDGWQWLIYIVKFWMRDPPGGPNSFNFMQFLRKFGKNLMLVPPPGELVPPHRTNPGSDTGWCPDSVADQGFS